MMIFTRLDTVCHRFRLMSKMIIFGPVLITFELSSNSGGGWGSIENWFEPKNKSLSGNFACPNL